MLKIKNDISSNQITGNNKKYINTNKATRQPLVAGMIKNNCNDSKCA